MSSNPSPRLRGSMSLGNWRLAIAGAFVALLLELLFVGSYVGALHDPKPRQALPFGVFGPQNVVSTLVAQLETNGGGVVDPQAESSSDALRKDIDNLKIFGGLEIGQQGATLVVADAAGSAAASALTLFAQGLAASQNMPLTVEHVHPLSPGDPRGLALVYLVFGWVFGGYFCATVLTALRGPGFLSRTHAALRLVLVAGYAILSGVFGALLTGPWIGAIDGHFWAMALAGSFIVFAVTVATMAVQLLLGIGGTALVLIAFVLIGNPSSGGIVPGQFLPGFWRVIGPWLPNWAGFTLTRNLVYFDGNRIARPLVLLAVYAVVGAIIVLLFATHKRRGVLGLGESEIEAASAAAGAAA
jgi:hypothetical protein